jgi:hypothetical protein
VECGSILMGKTAGGTPFQMRATRGYMREGLPADVKVVDLMLMPNVEFAERFDEIEEIWGGKMEINGVRLERYDLDPK